MGGLPTIGDAVARDVETRGLQRPQTRYTGLQNIKKKQPAREDGRGRLSKDAKDETSFAHEASTLRLTSGARNGQGP